MATDAHIICLAFNLGSFSTLVIVANGVVTLDSIGGIKNAGA